MTGHHGETGPEWVLQAFSLVLDDVAEYCVMGTAVKKGLCPVELDTELQLMISPPPRYHVFMTGLH